MSDARLRAQLLETIANLRKTAADRPRGLTDDQDVLRREVLLAVANQMEQELPPEPAP